MGLDAALEYGEAASKSEFKGEWGPACICNETLTWNEGEDVPITIISSKVFQMNYVGKTYTARLRIDGELQWDDGDVWSRRHHTENLNAQTLASVPCQVAQSTSSEHLVQTASRPTPAKESVQLSDCDAQAPKCTHIRGKSLIMSEAIDMQRFIGSVKWFRG